MYRKVAKGKPEPPHYVRRVTPDIAEKQTSIDSWMAIISH